MPPPVQEFTEIGPNQSQSGWVAVHRRADPGPCARIELARGLPHQNPNYTFTTWFYSGGTMFLYVCAGADLLRLCLRTAKLSRTCPRQYRRSQIHL